ncbi:hypothetical protein BV898_18242 [Hypsibius exemplaris]|uniref:arylamine N-acetyltransferase n=1 Tax=Hypsibius exemplaris TaxID=2072580 RepID=A0A9X6NGG8_HYPEX|nr:hypothetical protein BV898_18242 [Hypsibius exemplaris]
MSAYDNLTRAEAVQYFSQQLKLQLTEEELALPSLSTLQKICRAYNAEVPFSSVRFLLTPVEERVVSSLDLIKEIGMTKSGGGCYELNVFLRWLLVAVGYDVKFLLGQINGAVYNHSLLLIRLPDGKRYLVDAGALPMLNENIMCLDFEGEVSPVYQQSLWHLRLERRQVNGEPGYVVKYHVNPNTEMHWKVEIDETNYAQFIEFNLVERTIEELSAVRRACFKDAKLSPIMDRIFVYRFPRGRFTLSAGTMYVYEDENRNRVMVPTKTREEAVEQLRAHFGDFLSEETANRAIDKYIENVGADKAFVAYIPKPVDE